MYSQPEKGKSGTPEDGKDQLIYFLNQGRRKELGYN